MVRTPWASRRSSVFFPTQSRSRTPSGHIFSSTSCSQSVCTLSGFSKSEAIFASSLLAPIPTFTVKPSEALISSLSRVATATALSLLQRKVMSMKHSSMENCCRTGE